MSRRLEEWANSTFRGTATTTGRRVIASGTLTDEELKDTGLMPRFPDWIRVETLAVTVTLSDRDDDSLDH